MNKLLLGDNLEILKNMDSEIVDLIYLDPPFFSNRNYEVIWGDKGEIRSFQDRFSGGIDHYIGWLKERVIEMHRILKPIGSIFLHCDWHANSYIRVHILDKIFGETNFRGEIIWQRTSTHNDAKKKLAVLTDTIWYYSKGSSNIYNPIYASLSDEYKNSAYTQNDNDGKGLYRLDNMASPNPRPNMMYEWKGYSFPLKGWRYEKTTMQKLDEEGKIFYPKDKMGNPDYSKRLALKRYLDEQKGVVVGNFWSDITNVQSQSKEKIGYPTQKPEKLLERILQMASNEGDTILDPFVGGGTTVAIADKLRRKWIAIDQSVQAVKVTEQRLFNQMDLFSQPFMTQLHKYDYDTLRNKEAFEFEHFIVQQFGGFTNSKQRGDLGIDGRTRENTPIQVKRSDNIGRNVVDNFISAAKRYDASTYELNKAENKPIGYIIAFSFGKGAIQEVARLKNEEGVSIKLVLVEEILPMAKKPTLTVTVTDQGKDAKGHQTLQFVANAQSESGIEFYSWDFAYSEETRIFKAEIMLDKKGEQVYKFKAGLHKVAVKVIDNEGLENIEIIRLKINGKLEINS
jgi:DNA modification methylase